MRMTIKAMWVLVLLLMVCRPLKAQSHEIEQLLLNVEKLAQFKKILQDMYEGYRILEKGYNKVKDIASGNYKLHQVFLDGLLAVSPQVRNYYKVGLIIEQQIQLVRQYKAAFHLFKGSKMFSADELRYFERVYKGLFDESISNLDALLVIVTAGKVRMGDDERMAAIDRLATEMAGKLRFLRRFNDDAQMLAIQRTVEQHEIDQQRRLHGIE